MQCLTCMVTTTTAKTLLFGNTLENLFLFFVQPTACRYKMTGLFLQITPCMCRFLSQRKGQQKHAGARRRIKAYLLSYEVVLPAGSFTALHPQTSVKYMSASMFCCVNNLPDDRRWISTVSVVKVLMGQLQHFFKLRQTWQVWKSLQHRNGLPQPNPSPCLI